MINARIELLNKGFLIIPNWETPQVIRTILDSVIDSKGELNDALFSYWTNSRTTELVSELIGKQMFAHTCNIRNKDRESYKQIPYHQDSAYILPQSFDSGDFLQITCWMPLVDVSILNGTIQIEHSFKNEMRKHVYSDDYLQIDPSSLPVCTFPVEIHAGGVLFMHHNLIHGSGINKTINTRWSIDFRFQNKQIDYQNFVQGFEIRPNQSLSFEQFKEKKVRVDCNSPHKFSLLKK